MWVYGETEGMPKARGLLDNFIKAHSERHTLWKTVKTELRILEVPAKTFSERKNNGGFCSI